MKPIDHTTKMRTRFLNERYPIHPVGETKTRQSEKDDCDINLMIAKFGSGSVLPGGTQLKEENYFDCSAVPDFQSAMNHVIESKKMFSNLSSEIRKRFNNNVHELMAFVNDDSNYTEALSLGFLDETKADVRQAPKVAAKAATVPPSSPPTSPP